MRKYLIALFLIAFCMFGLHATPNAPDLSEEALDEQVTQLLDNIWNEYGLVHYQLVKTEPTISIGMNASNDKAALQSILEKKLPKQALALYEIEIFQRNKKEFQFDHE